MRKLVSESNKGTIVLVHGAFEHAGRYDWLAKKWYEEGFNVIYDDLPGQGMSQGLRGHIDSFDEYIEAIEQWTIEAKKYNKPVLLLGHSMGGLAVVRMMEEKKPEYIKGVILSSPGLGIASRPPKWVIPISRTLEKIFPRLQVRTRLEPCVSTRNKRYHNRQKDPLFLKKVSIRWYHEFERAIRIAFQKVQNYPPVPTLLMQAGRDFLINVKDVRNWFNQLTIPEKRYNEWEQLYHEIFNEPEREEVFEYAKKFVDEVVEN
ncbi:alpha/beta hydrolase [Salirhabdus sp. Marseille-P4669]|uniref:alpha/beta hydrolase n=1 Tax=Salirhabdus sp. Marseille-P4669 TaxID=2042310 RepID=UPI000C7B1B7B|nr:alpha/beta hydrolase [Salirhabdus sp. Marseille-P4669]